MDTKDKETLESLSRKLADLLFIDNPYLATINGTKLIEFLTKAHNLGANTLAEKSKENIEKYSPTTGKHPHVFHSLVKSLYKKTAKEIINSTLKELVK